jgi:hypothetical protein
MKTRRVVRLSVIIDVITYMLKIYQCAKNRKTFYTKCSFLALPTKKLNTFPIKHNEFSFSYIQTTRKAIIIIIPFHLAITINFHISKLNLPSGCQSSSLLPYDYYTFSFFFETIINIACHRSPEIGHKWNFHSTFSKTNMVNNNKKT